MSTACRRQLDDIKFDWDPSEDAWEKGFAALKQFKARERHCRVPRMHQEGAFNLGTWVVNRRNRRDTLSVQRRQQLDAIGFVWRSSLVLFTQPAADRANAVHRTGYRRHLELCVSATQRVVSFSTPLCRRRQSWTEMHIGRYQPHHTCPMGAALRPAMIRRRCRSIIEDQQSKRCVASNGSYRSEGRVIGLQCEI